jgi:hypothetical protein
VQHPRSRGPERSFWRTAVAEPDALDVTDLWTPKFTIGQDAPVVAGPRRPAFCRADDTIHGDLAFSRLVAAELGERGP